MKQYVTIGIAVLAGTALFEVALIPGVLIGSAAALTPLYLSRRRRRPNDRPAQRQPTGKPSAASSQRLAKRIEAILPRTAIGQAIAKTITFRLIVTTLDFTTNYVVIGEIATAAGLSTFNVIAGPLFYFAHEATWNYLGASETGVEFPAVEADAGALHAGSSFTISRPLAKTITYRTIATVMDFTTNYLVVGSVAEAMILSASGFVLGPFVYFGHEKAWECLAPPPAGEFLPANEIKPLTAAA
jgi:uncharacterized membrane protein